MSGDERPEWMNMKDKENSSKLPTVLKRLMNERSVSARALAKATGISASTLSTYLAGKKTAYKAEHLKQLADYFSVNLDTLLFDRKAASKNFSSLKTEKVFSGWAKITVEKLAVDEPDDS